MRRPYKSYYYYSCCCFQKEFFGGRVSYNTVIRLPRYPSQYIVIFTALSDLHLYRLCVRPWQFLRNEKGKKWSTKTISSLCLTITSIAAASVCLLWRMSWIKAFARLPIARLCIHIYLSEEFFLVSHWQEQIQQGTCTSRGHLWFDFIAAAFFLPTARLAFFPW